MRNKEHGEECKDDCLGLMVTSSNEDHIHLSFPQEHVKLISEIAIHDSDGDIQVQLSGAGMLSQILP